MINLRICSVCKQKKNKTELIKITEVNGVYVINPDNKTFGRSCYICNNGDCAMKAKKVKALDRSFKHSVPKELYDNLASYEDRQ